MYRFTHTECANVSHTGNRNRILIETINENVFDNVRTQQKQLNRFR